MAYGDPITTTITANTSDTAAVYTGSYNNNYGGYHCSCGSWVPHGTTHYCGNYTIPQQIIVYPQPYYMPPTPTTLDYATQTRLASLEQRLVDMQGALERLMDLLDKDQDEKVCGYSEGESDSADSGGGTGTALEVRVKARIPKGSTTWPPRS